MAKSTDKNENGYNLTFGSVKDEGSMKKAYGLNIINNLKGIHGAPYQFMETVDSRPEGSKLGRKYLERIVTRMPLLLITPGEPNYLSGFSQNTKNNLLSYISELGIGKKESSIQDLLSSESSATRYFTLDFAYAQYYKYVNAMLRMASRFLEIHGRTFPEKDGKEVPLWKYDWSYHTMSNLPGVLSSKEYVAFYVESEDSVTESISSDTTQSVLASTLEQGSETVNEIRFLMGAYGASLNTDLDSDSSNEAMTKLENAISGSIFKNNRLIKRLLGDAKTIVAGGKIIFPEIWSDTNFSHDSKTFTIKLRTPDCDKFSWFINIFVPLAHLICLAAPRQAFTDGKTNPNAYYSPFLIRAFYKGVFSVEMGIADLSISKGAKGSWTYDGLPCEVDVDLTIKDLYTNSLVINKFVGRESWSLVKATSMTDYIATSCGCNINKPDLARMVDLFAMQKYNRVADIPRNAWLNIEQSAASSLSTFFRSGHLTF